MKQLIFLALILPTLAMAQMGEVQKESPKTTIGRLATLGYLQAELYYRVDEGDTVNTIMFRNVKYSTIVDFQSAVFIGGVEIRRRLRDAVLSCFKDENVRNKDFQLSFKLGDDNILLFNRLGFSNVQVVFYVGEAYFLLTERQAHKLFGDE